MKFFKAVLLTGLFTGTTDILYAFINSTIQSGNYPELMFHYIAGGLLGLDKSMQGGVLVGVLGLCIHYAIAIFFTFLLFWLFSKWSFLHYNKFLVGILYGVFVNLVMRYLVLPITPLPVSGKLVLERQFIDWIIFGTVFGIPIVYNAYRFYGIADEPMRSAI